MEFLPQNYPFEGHPDCWDLRNAYSYLPYYLLLRRSQDARQIGKADDARLTRRPSSIMDRAFCDRSGRDGDSGGLRRLLLIRDAAQKLGGKAELYVQGGGHDFVVPRALTLLAPD